MVRKRAWHWVLIGFALVSLVVVAGRDARFVVLAQQSHPLLGGSWGMVRSSTGASLEGIGVQLISANTSIRTTVYTNDDGRYEFPTLEAGTYTLRITRPLEFRPYQRDTVQINGPEQFENIVLERVSDDEYLPPTPEILAQLTGVEWMMNLPGTGKEKRVFTLSCGFGCHSYNQIFRNRYDEQGWRLIVRRMLRGAGSPLINLRQPQPGQTARAGIPRLEEEEVVIGWLSKVRGPDSEIPPLHVLPRPRGAATRVIVTEYELPRTLISTHDVHGDSQGNIWYTPHRSPYVGALDPKTGRVTEYRLPDVPGVLPGTHRIWVDERDIVYASENWRQNLARLDPRTGEFQQFHFEGGTPNSPGFSNFAMGPEGYVYETLRNEEGQQGVVKIDRDTGEIVRHYPLERWSGAYDNIVSLDGRYWAGGGTGGNLIGLVDLQTGENWTLETPTVVSSPARGGFDFEGNAWLGGRGGMFIRLDPRTRKITEFYPPIPYVAFYEILPDKNGEVWGAPMHSGRFLRFNPRTERWIDYMLPEPFSHNRRAWIDNSTDPVNLWYVDNNGYMVHIQPLD